MDLAKKNKNNITEADLSGRKIGEILINEGLITIGQFQNALKYQKELKEHMPIGQILINQNAITQKMLSFVLNRFHKQIRLGDLLIQSGVLTKEQLELALKHQKKMGIRLGNALVELNYITEHVMKQTLCTQLNIPFLDFANITLKPELSKLINKNYALKHGVVPIATIGQTMTLLMDDPTKIELIEELQQLTGYSINVVTSTKSDIIDAFAELYEEIKQSEKSSGIELIYQDSEEANTEPKHFDAQRKKKADYIAQRILAIALKYSASDIHLDVGSHGIVPRFRIDGVLQELHLGSIKKDLNTYSKEVVSRIKIIGNLDITERRRPQDGRFRVVTKKNEQKVNVDFRISIVPGYYGENIVIRILDPQNAPTSIDKLGFSKLLRNRLHQIVSKSTGVILVTGPTGSGKSTTLYGALMEVYKPGIKILTTEDPIEYVYDKITQCEVNDKIGNTFARYIKAFLRQDPDVIMVGEIRDFETADMVFKAAQTGHLVLTTLHTNDAIGSITRLKGLDVDPSLITSCLTGVLAQRLVRRNCQHCKTEYVPDNKLLKEFFDDSPDILWFKGQGCSKCNYTGYSGRIVIAELWTPSQEDAILINKGSSIDSLRKTSYKSSILMADEAMQKLNNGETTLEELIRTLPFSSIYDFRPRS
ncbi:MAG: Flp pilus assembly complex ATPase component TadA [Desulfobacteraceae bacterium]|nr:Flp pilus assembly complex ATPase component TadA [Desulfobacteraceae bacterium]MBC2719220.1 Flp pilus assembly complex ATPase component TadA [Desulfobacteraceae bacterium]